MNAKIKTAGDLRSFLAKTMEEVRAGEIDLDVASRITKLAGQVNESFYAEIKVAKIRAEAGETLIELGALPLSSGSEGSDEVPELG